MKNTSILIIDPTMLFREGLRHILGETDFTPIWCADVPPADAILPAPGSEPDDVPLLIIGTDLDKVASQIATVKDHYQNCRVILFADPMPPDAATAMLDLGAHSILPRAIPPDAFVRTLKMVLEGFVVLPPTLLGSLMERRDVARQEQSADPAAPTTGAGPGHPVDSATSAMNGNATLRAFRLSGREISVLRGLQGGLPNKQIARDLEITEATVKVHVKSILRKANVRNRTQIALWATRMAPSEIAQ